MIEVYKVLNGLTRVEKHEWFQFMPEERRGTRQTTWIDDGGRVNRKADVMKIPNAHTEIRKKLLPLPGSSRMEWFARSSEGRRVA